MRSRMSVPVGALESKSRWMTASSCSRLSKVEKSRSGKQLAGKDELAVLVQFKGMHCRSPFAMRVLLIQLRLGREGGSVARRNGEAHHMSRPPFTPQTCPVM